MPQVSIEGWGPNRLPAAVSITFDNMGEASEIELGTWTDDRPVGRHPGVIEYLPKLLEILGDTHITYFVEGWSAEVYPDAVRGVAGRGHEIAIHGYRHELWGKLRGLPDKERAIFEMSLSAMERLGIRPRGFRPPGGDLTEATPSIMHELGLNFASPRGRGASLRDRIAMLAFDWRNVDAYYYQPEMKPVRVHYGDGRDPLPAVRLLERLESDVDNLVREGGYLTVIFHPFFYDRAERLEAFEQIVDGLRRREDIWLAPCGEVADFLFRSDQSGFNAA